MLLFILFLYVAVWFGEALTIQTLINTLVVLQTEREPFGRVVSSLGKTGGNSRTPKAGMSLVGGRGIQGHAYPGNFENLFV